MSVWEDANKLNQKKNLPANLKPALMEFKIEIVLTSAAVACKYWKKLENFSAINFLIVA